MLGLLTDYFAANDNNEERCRAVAEKMLRLVTSKGRVVLDSAATHRFCSSYAMAFQAACSLALSEQIQIRSTESGEVELVANWDYERLLWLESNPEAGGEAGAADEADDDVVTAALADMIEQLDAVEIPAASEETTRIFQSDQEEPLAPEPVAEPAKPAIPAAAGEFDWFTIDVAPPEDESALAEENVALDRQSLPERKREPYVALEDAVLEKWEK